MNFNRIMATCFAGLVFVYILAGVLLLPLVLLFWPLGWLARHLNIFGLDDLCD